MTHTTRPSAKAFDNAIASGTLSVTSQDENYAGNYMYMYSAVCDGYIEDFFKNINTRQYIRVLVLD